MDKMESFQYIAQYARSQRNYITAQFSSRIDKQTLVCEPKNRIRHAIFS